MMIFLAYVIAINFILSLLVIMLSLAVILIFARKGARCYTHVAEKIKRDNEFFHELIFVLESAGKNVSTSSNLKRSTRVAIWELYNILCAHPSKEGKSITLQRKILEEKQELYNYLEEGRVNLEILPFFGIIGTLLGFAVPFLLNLSVSAKITFDATGIGFFLATSSTVCALIALIYLKKTYEGKVMADWEYYIQQQKSLEKILIDYDGFKYLTQWVSAEKITENGSMLAESEEDAHSHHQFNSST